MTDLKDVTILFWKDVVSFCHPPFKDERTLESDIFILLFLYTDIKTFADRPNTSAHVPKWHGAIQLQSKKCVAALDASMIEVISPVFQVYHYAGSIGGFESKLCHVDPLWIGRTCSSLFLWDITDIFPGVLEVKGSK